MDAFDLEEISGLLHLTPCGADMYLTLLAQGELSRKELEKILELSKSEIAKGIDELLKKEMVFRLKTEKRDDVFKALSVFQLEENLEIQKEVVRNLKKFVMPRFQPPQKLGLIKYEGVEGVRKVYQEVLEEAIKTKQDILAFENGTDFDDLGNLFFERYIAKRIESKIKAYVITPDAPADREYKKEYEGKFTYIKLVKNLDIKANINIVSDLVMTFSLDPAQGTLRRNHDEACTLKAVFKKLWENN